MLLKVTHIATYFASSLPCVCACVDEGEGRQGNRNLCRTLAKTRTFYMAIMTLKTFWYDWLF